MTKVICDICGKDIALTKHIMATDGSFGITNYGVAIDVCGECRIALKEWVKKRKVENGMTQKESVK